MLERDGLIVTRGAAGTRVADAAVVLPAALVAEIRALVGRARVDGVREDDVVSAIRGVWAGERMGRRHGNPCAASTLTGM